MHYDHFQGESKKVTSKQITEVEDSQKQEVVTVQGSGSNKNTNRNKIIQSGEVFKKLICKQGIWPPTHLVAAAVFLQKRGERKCKEASIGTGGSQVTPFEHTRIFTKKIAF